MYMCVYAIERDGRWRCGTGGRIPDSGGKLASAAQAVESAIAIVCTTTATLTCGSSICSLRRSSRARLVVGPARDPGNVGRVLDARVGATGAREVNPDCDMGMSVPRE